MSDTTRTVTSSSRNEYLLRLHEERVRNIHGHSPEADQLIAQRARRLGLEVVAARPVETVAVTAAL